ncbi:uncharacterized protein LOC106642162 [Copidosoma floridanum]|uniref:uncharacterized protein LOC106642162 n=1 Tax=Copidosoma floridanum TaxID=29053 RepID=UPI0006C9C557|nr:uncharacterized protein LOC106642162 [Copidosoma floridanum]
MDGSTQGSIESYRGPRLPQINIPTFSGKWEDWEPFRDLFRALIHEEKQLTNVKRLFYLKSLVQGGAKATLDTVQMMGSNYTTAWNLLEAHFQHRRLLIQDHLSAHRNLKPLQDKSAAGLKRLLDTLKRHCDQLRVLKCPVNHWNHWLVDSATTGLDPTTKCY